MTEAQAAWVRRGLRLGVDYRQVARDLKLDEEEVHRHGIEAGILERDVTYRVKQELQRLAEESPSPRQVAQSIGCSRSLVQKVAKELGIELAPKGHKVTQKTLAIVATLKRGVGVSATARMFNVDSARVSFLKRKYLPVTPETHIN